MRTINSDLTEEQVAQLRLASVPFGSITLPARIVERLTLAPCGCWRVSGYNSGNGYAKISLFNKTRYVHRVVWQLLIGEIPQGHILDHRCDLGCAHRDCCNALDHMEPVTVQVNTRRGSAVLFK